MGAPERGADQPRRRFITRTHVEDAAASGQPVRVGPRDVVTDEAAQRAADLGVTIERPPRSAPARARIQRCAPQSGRRWWPSWATSRQASIRSSTPSWPRAGSEPIAGLVQDRCAPGRSGQPQPRRNR